VTETEACPSFSIVIPTYQRRDLVCQSVRSLSCLDYGGAIEIIVVVDGSDDGTAAALKKLDSPCPLRVIEQPNAGAGAARNRGAAVASGDILLFLDDDMICETDLIEQHARMYRDGADAVLGYIPLDPQTPAGFLSDDIAGYAKTMLEGFTVTPFDVYSGQLSVRRSAFEQLGGFDETLTSGALYGNEDCDFGVRLLESCDVRHNPKAVSRHRYVVSAREKMRRVRPLAAADIRFARKHPQLGERLFRTRGGVRPVTRFLYRPLSRVPGLPQLLSWLAVRATQIALKTRFHSNWLLAHVYMAARAITYWEASRANGGFPRADTVLILCYHAIADLRDDPVLAGYGVSRSLFVEHLKLLKREGFTFISPTELLALIEGRGRVPKRAVLLTFDDCYEELLEVARTILQPRGIPAIAFAVSGVPSNTNAWDQGKGARTLRLLNPEELRQLDSLGVEIGCHSRSHRPLPDLSDTELKTEIRGAAGDLQSAGLPGPRFFAYPYGESDERCRSAVEDAGFSAAFGVLRERIRPASDRYNLPRMVVFGDDVGWRFRLKIRWPEQSRRFDDR
jgi:glycosyltransferase involved in cell wall biosynthesis/peptidoglycan/xylan/chitin deacetylase (PgdA/CDA1 family)